MHKFEGKVTGYEFLLQYIYQQPKTAHTSPIDYEEIGNY